MTDKIKLFDDCPENRPPEVLKFIKDVNERGIIGTRGRPKALHSKTPIAVRIEPALLAALRISAGENDRTLTAELHRAISHYLAPKNADMLK